MAKNYFIRYNWLINTIDRNGPLPFGELQRLWLNSPFNETKEPLARRTFFHHRSAIYEMFGIGIRYRKGQGFYIDTEDFDSETFRNICEIAYLSRNFDENMSKNQLKRCVWLIDTVRSRQPIEFEDLNSAWMNCSVNDDKTELSRRTLQNHLADVRDLFGINIGHSHGG